MFNPHTGPFTLGHYHSLYHSILLMRCANLGPGSIFVSKSARFILPFSHAIHINSPA
jgi:hypothetical protein